MLNHRRRIIKIHVSLVFFSSCKRNLNVITIISVILSLNLQICFQNIVLGNFFHNPAKTENYKNPAKTEIHENPAKSLNYDSRKKINSFLLLKLCVYVFYIRRCLV